MSPNHAWAWKKHKSIGNTLVRAKLKNVEDSPESFRISITPNLGGHSGGCGILGYKCCRMLSRKLRITSASTNKSYSTPGNTNCNSNYVIYLIECTKCNKHNQYVGQTQRQLKHRIANHRASSKSTLKNKVNLPIYKHFTGKKGHDFERDARVTVL